MCNETNPSHQFGSNGAQEPRPYSEEEQPPTNDVDDLKWRGDPELTFSDWTIEIVTNKEPEEEDFEDDGNGVQESKEENCGDYKEKTLVETVTTYHVHKCSLAYGTRKSEYFARLFRNASTGMFNETNASLSRIELEPLAGSAFPSFLDYIYAPERPLDINTNSATALHSLGEYFEIRYLRWDARQFCLKDMSLKNIDTYYEHAMIFGNESILGLVAQFTGKNLLKISPSSDIVKKAEPAFWVKALNAARKACVENEEFWGLPQSCHWSRLMSEIGTLNVETMDKAVFDELTNVSNMPDVHAEVALTLCEMDDGLHAGDETTQTEIKDESSPKPLQKRCGAALAETWEAFIPNENTVRLLEHRQPTFLVALLLKCMEKAKSSLEAKDRQLDNMRKELRSSQSNASSLSTSLNRYQDQLNACQAKLKTTQELMDDKKMLKKWKLLPSNDYSSLSLSYESMRSSVPVLCDYYPELANYSISKALYSPNPHGFGRIKYPVFYYDPNA